MQPRLDTPRPAPPAKVNAAECDANKNEEEEEEDEEELAPGESPGIIPGWPRIEGASVAC